MPSITEKNRQIGIITPLGEDELLLRACRVTEELGRLFHLDLDLRSENYEIAFKDIVGQNITVRLELLNGGTRFFNGYVNSFRQELSEDGLAHYRATAVPWLWFLTRTADCRIFQNKSVPDIVKQVFRDHGFTDFKESLSGTYREWEYCVQYRETDFNFVSRLMEQEGVYYYFEHKNGKHTLVMIDASATHGPYEGYEKISFLPTSATASVADEYIRHWSAETAIQPGTFAQKDFDFKIPGKDLLTSRDIAREHAHSEYEVYDYPGEYVEKSNGETWSGIRIEELHTPHEVLRGESDARGISAGFTFELTKFPREDQCKPYLITGASLLLQGDAFQTGEGGGHRLYSASFSAMDLTRQFRPRRSTPKPSIAGPQTAIVVGPPGDEIHTDEFGRVKLQFHWDREGESNQNSSCWVRVSQLWAGRKWGAVHLPRIGQEVIVEFLEGDPDHPIVTGRVYNGQEMPPYGLPGEKTKSCVKSNSSQGGGGFNELRFEDKKGGEQVFIHAQRNMDTRVRNNSMTSIVGNQHITVGYESESGNKGDRNEKVCRNESITVNANQSTHIGGDQKLLVGGIDGPGNQDIVIKENRKELVHKDRHLHVMGNKKELVDQKLHLHVVGDRNEGVDGKQSLSVGGDQHEKVGMSHALDAGQEIHLKAGMKVIIEAGVQLSLKGPGGFIDIGPAGVTVQGIMVKINSGGSAGSGSGASPATPDNADDAAEAGPTKPRAADNAKPGMVDRVPY